MAPLPAAPLPHTTPCLPHRLTTLPPTRSLLPRAAPCRMCYTALLPSWEGAATSLPPFHYGYRLPYTPPRPCTTHTCHTCLSQRAYAEQMVCTACLPRALHVTAVAHLRAWLIYTAPPRTPHLPRHHNAHTAPHHPAPHIYTPCPTPAPHQRR